MLSVACPFPLSREGDVLDALTGLDELGPGVRGYAIERDGAVYVPVIEAVRQGSGDVGRWLDGLPAGLDVRIPCVVSARLLGMLKRRGWVPSVEVDATFGEAVVVWVRPT